jgi:hypothetical protein
MKALKSNSRIGRLKNRIKRANHIGVLVAALTCLMSGFALPNYCRSAAGNLNQMTPHSIEAWLSNGPHELIRSLAIDPGNPNIIYAGSWSGVFKSTDGGATWSNMGLAYTPALVIDFVNPNIIHAGTFPGGLCSSAYPLFKSTDGGATWSNAGSPAECDISLIVMDPTSPETIYAGSEAEYFGAGGIKLWKSTDRGASWGGGSFTGNIGLASYGMVIDPINPQVLYAPGDLYSSGNVIDSGLFKSTDGGATWEATDLHSKSVSAVALDPVNPDIIYAGTFEYVSGGFVFRGLLKSTDGGASWFAINSGLTGLIGTTSVITAFATQPGNPNTLYAGTSGSGVFKSTDGGASWSEFNDGLSNPFINALAIDSYGTQLHAATRDGVFSYQFTASCVAQISLLNQFFSSTGGTGTVNVTDANQCGWTASSNAGWIIITSPDSGTGPGTVTFEVRENLTGSARAGAMTIAGQSFTVVQNGEPGEACRYSISPKFQTIPASGGVGSVDVSTDDRCAWEARSNASWITIISQSSGIGSRVVSYSVAANPNGSGRKGTMTIAGRTLSVKQKPN